VSLTFCEAVGRGCPICETRAVALAILLPQLCLALNRPRSSILSWNAGSLVSALGGGVRSST
jgi:hypothetical protein